MSLRPKDLVRKVVFQFKNRIDSYPSYTFRNFSSWSHPQKRMSKSKFEYTRAFEQPDRCLPNAWIVVRVDGRSFHRFSDIHCFEKPNDDRALKLMNHCAQAVLDNFHDVVVAYGQSDEFSFIFKRKTETYNRRSSKLSSSVVSLFTSHFVYNWTAYFPSQKLEYPPSFDSRVILYPTSKNLRDYLSWRQVDCHINNMYNVCFWNLVLKGELTKQEAEKRLRGTDSAMKNELLFSEFNINYNNEAEIHKKGTIIYKEKMKKKCVNEASTQIADTTKESQCRMQIEHTDIIKEDFWNQHPTLLEKDIS